MWPNAPAVRLESHYGDRVVPCYANRPRSVDQMLSRAANDHPNSIALADLERRRTYAELNDSAEAIASGLAARGVRPGDRVALLLDNRLEFAEAFFGIIRAGAVAVPLNIRAQGPEMSYLIAHSGAKVLIHEAHSAARLPDGPTVPLPHHRIAVGGYSVGSEPYEELRHSHHPQREPASEDDTVAILYTSGTTGRPKGAMLTNLSIVMSTMNYEYCWELTSDDRALMAVPVSHVTGLVAILLTMVRVGGTTIFMRDFKAGRFLDMAAMERMTYTILVPAMYHLCLLQTGFDAVDLSQWRIGGFGGAPMPPATIARLAAMMPWLQLVNAYGATETTSPTTLMPVGQGTLYATTVGAPVPTAEIVIMDEASQEVPVGTTGDVWIRGGHVVAGYWQDAAATKESFSAGFWNSGDVGMMTEAGYLVLLDRKKDLINRGGYKVYSVEIEGVLMQHPNVAEAAIIPLPDSVLGEKIHAVVHAKNGLPTAVELQRFCAERLSDFKVPDYFSFVDEPLPRNAAGKILKRELSRSLAAAAPAGPGGLA